jgi:short-subunit dehydrogenase involved in D-alanine esterification of teichoic acids
VRFAARRTVEVTDFRHLCKGFEVAKSLVKVGAKVAITCKTQDKVDQTIAALKVQNKSANILGLVMDLATMDCVRDCADEYLKSGRGLNVLINNASIEANESLQRTAEGYEAQVTNTFSILKEFKCLMFD